MGIIMLDFAVPLFDLLICVLFLLCILTDAVVTTVLIVSFIG